MTARSSAASVASRAAALALVATLAACPDIAGFDGNPQMDPGQDCLACHSAGGSAASLAFTVGGTIFTGANGTQGLAGAQIQLTEVLVDGGSGRTMDLQSNGGGNFYTAEPMVPPFSVVVHVGATRFLMQQVAPSGACNACHALATNANGTLQTAPLSAVALDAGYARPPGHLYGFASDGGCPLPPGQCSGAPASYRDQIQAAVEGNCYPCHSANGDSVRLDSVAAISDRGAVNCLSQVGRCAMPLPDLGPMDPAQRQLLMDWLACGAPDN